MAFSMRRLRAAAQFQQGLRDLAAQGYVHMTFVVPEGNEFYLKRELFNLGARYVGHYGNGIVKGMVTRAHVEAVLAGNTWGITSCQRDEG